MVFALNIALVAFGLISTAYADHTCAFGPFTLDLKLMHETNDGG